jgi:hypothetical protein
VHILLYYFYFAYFSESSIGSFWKLEDRSVVSSHFLKVESRMGCNISELRAVLLLIVIVGGCFNSQDLT